MRFFQRTFNKSAYVNETIEKLSKAVFEDNLDEVKKIFKRADKKTKKILSIAHINNYSPDVTILDFAKLRTNRNQQMCDFLEEQKNNYSSTSIHQEIPVFNTNINTNLRKKKGEKEKKEIRELSENEKLLMNLNIKLSQAVHENNLDEVNKILLEAQEHDMLNELVSGKINNDPTDFSIVDYASAKGHNEIVDLLTRKDQIFTP